MSLLEMSFAGGVLILAVVVLRALALNRLPKATFLALWAVAVLRLLVPFSIPSPASVYTLAERVPVQTAAPAAAVSVPQDMPFIPGAAPAVGVSAAAVPETGAAVDVWFLVWLAGAAACGAFFLIAYLRCWREFRTALPVEDDGLRALLAERRLRRTVSLGKSDRIGAPMTYGIVRPVILFPNSTDWTDTSRLTYVLEHELAHIRHLDALWKLALAATACVHWFNPLVWCMFVLANRDMELRCDEAVVRRLGLDSRSGYALTLISMEEKKSGLGPFASAFSKNAIEERIIAVMKIKKHSIAAVIAAVVLVCCVGVGFATSAAKNKAPYPWVQEGTFTKEELDRLASLWFEGYEDMTVTDYQQKMWTERDTPEDIALIERYGQYYQLGGVFADDEATKDLNAFYVYFYGAYEPLTAERWQERIFPGVEGTRLEDGSAAFLEYTCTLHILDPDTLTVGEYQQVQADIKAGVKALMGPADPTEDDFAALSRRLSTDSLEVTVEAGRPIRSYAPVVDQETSVRVEIEGGYSYNDPDAELLAQFSREVAAEWDRLLSPYAPFGLTWEFDDPDLDGNGLTMWFQGKEVRSISDEQEHVWITEHTGNSAYSDGAVDLYVVYTDGRLSGLRLATAEEQAEFDDVRKYVPVNLASAEPRAVIEEREFPQSTMADYAAFRSLRTEDYWNLSLEEFNRRLLDWANENPDTWNRICCDVLWDDYPKELHDGLKLFAYLTCTLSGTENGQMVRALYTGEPEQDPSFSENMPERLENYVEGGVNAWCDLYYEISYHIADKSKVTVEERNNCFNYMRNAIYTFWQNTDMDALLQMTEEDVVEQFNIWAAEHSTENVTFHPVTVDDIHFEAYDERGID